MAKAPVLHVRRTPYFVSFHPQIEMEENLPLLQHLGSESVARLLARARGVVLPKYVSPWRYRTIVRYARCWFPRLEARFLYHGKVRQIELFRRLGVRCPDTRLFKDPQHLRSAFRQWGSPWGYPLVLKGDSGGGGSRVFLIEDQNCLLDRLSRLPADEPVLLQQLIHHGGYDLRVVVYGDGVQSYFRHGSDGFYNNVCRGGSIHHRLWPEKQRIGARLVRSFCQRVGMDIVAFDLMFDSVGTPLFVEMNFNFGKKGLGGAHAHHLYFEQAVMRWRQTCLASR